MNNNRTERAELHKTIWRIANDLRGSVDGWDFKLVLACCSPVHLGESHRLLPRARIPSIPACAVPIRPRLLSFRPLSLPRASAKYSRSATSSRYQTARVHTQLVAVLKAHWDIEVVSDNKTADAAAKILIEDWDYE